MRLYTSAAVPGSNTTLVHELKANFPEVFQAGLGKCTKTQAQLKLKPGATPVFRKARPVPYAARAAVTQELERLVKEGVYVPVDHSRFATPIVVVKKKNGTLRLCADYSTGLNAVLEDNNHPLPTAEDIFAALNGGKYFSQIDLAEAYLQIEADPEAQEMLTINTHLGLFRPTRLPFGVKCAPGIFQGVMDALIAGLPSTFAYLDDIIVCGRTEAEHNANVRLLFERIKEYGLRVREEKCSFLQKKIQYLGHVIDEHGRQPDPGRIQAIVNMPAPNDLTGVRSFLGMINYYCAFLPEIRNLRYPFDELCKKNVDSIGHSSVSRNSTK